MSAKLTFAKFSGIVLAPTKRAWMLDDQKLYAFIGERIRQIRETHSPRMSQQELAEILNLKRTSVTNIERGNQKPTLDALYLLCDHFGLKLESVLPSVSEVTVKEMPAAERSVTVGGKSHEVGAMTAKLVEKLRPITRGR
jgi:DNA-binding XRE family transcriptional regulator